MIYEGGVKTAYFLPKALKGDGTIVYYVVRTDGNKYYIHLTSKKQEGCHQQEALIHPRG